MEILSRQDLNKNPPRELVLESLNTPPSNPSNGQAYYDTNYRAARVYRGGEWHTLLDPSTLWFDELREWRIAIGKRPRGVEASGVRTIEPPSIYVIGDSLTEGDGVDSYQDSWPHQVADALETRFGQVAEYIPALQGSDTGGVDYPNPWTRTGNTYTEYLYSIGGRGTIMEAGSTLSINVSDVDRVGIVYAAGPSTGTLTVSLDGTTLTTINTATGGGLQEKVSWESDVISGTTLTVAASGANSHFNGALLIRNPNAINGVPDKSPQLWQGAHHGWNFANYLQYNFYYTGLENAVRPDLVVISLGANDFMGGRPVADVQADLTTMITNIRNTISGRDPSFLFVKQPLNSAAWPAFVDALANTARGLGAAVLDMQWAMDPLNNTSYLASDGIHLNEIGQQFYIDSFLEALPLPEYDAPATAAASSGGGGDPMADVFMLMGA